MRFLAPLLFAAVSMPSLTGRGGNASDETDQEPAAANQSEEDPLLIRKPLPCGSPTGGLVCDGRRTREGSYPIENA
ncbi:MAG: hypothetical protein NVS3B20_19550 [Polyangiales bacterium]